MNAFTSFFRRIRDAGRAADRRLAVPKYTPPPKPEPTVQEVMAAEALRPVPPLPPLTHPNTDPQLTERMVMEILEHEAIVREAYKDSVGVWTWGVGVTDASGHRVGRYKDKPATLERVLEIYVWLLRRKYLPEVMAAMHPVTLTEYERAAALSFHYNTGAIARAEWVRLFKQGKRDEARAAFMNWSKPREIIGRRKAERDLFFDGKWTTDGHVLEYTRVAKPSYVPVWGSAKRIDVREAVREAMAK